MRPDKILLRVAVDGVLSKGPSQFPGFDASHKIAKIVNCKLSFSHFMLLIYILYRVIYPLEK